MNLFFKKYHRLLFYTGWLVVNLIQAANTELFDDEAYYWVYAKFPAWGYFDHPPMIALLIRMGYSLFSNELGVRFFIVLLNTGALFFIEELTDKKNPRLFYAICCSLAVAQIGGMIAVPDTPLMFFVALFFWMYRKYTGNINLSNAVFLGLSIALMLYSKYHGVLIVFFTVLSNLKLFYRYQTYLVMMVALLLFAPHLYWQYQHDFPSVQYHLFERNAGAYHVSYSLEYIGGQIALAGPVIGWLLLYGAFLYKPISDTEKALRFTLIGIFVFFLLSTLKGRVEANWTIPAYAALIVLCHQYFNQNPGWAKWIYRTVPVTLLLVFAIRFYMMLDLPVAQWLGKDEFHQNKVWVNAITRQSDGLPVVMLNSYQKPSKYQFYSGKSSMSMNTPAYRRNNYNFWPIEDSMMNKPVFVLGAYDPVLFNIKLPDSQLKENGGKFVSSYFSFSRVLFQNIRKTLIADNVLQISFTIISPSGYLDYFQRSPLDTSMVQLAIFKDKEILGYIPSSLTVKQINQTRLQKMVSFRLKLSTGKYTGKLAITNCIPGQPSLNSTAFHFEIR